MSKLFLKEVRKKKEKTLKKDRHRRLFNILGDLQQHRLRKHEAVTRRSQGDREPWLPSERPH